jgi:hypothetical protein
VGRINRRMHAQQGSTPEHSRYIHRLEKRLLMCSHGARTFFLTSPLGL